MENMELIIFEMISNGGNAKALVYEAIACSQEGDFDKVDKLLKEADSFLRIAHQVQTTLIQQEASGQKNEVTILFVHAQDHLMSAIEVRNLSEQIIRMNKRLAVMENKMNG